jgi:hypothetical protein
MTELGIGHHDLVRTAATSQARVGRIPAPVSRDGAKSDRLATELLKRNFLG